MAAGALCKMRLVTGSDVLQHIEISNTNLAKFVAKFETSRLKLLTIAYAGAFSNGYTEISAPNAILDGVATPIIVYAISSSASDDSAADDHAQTVTVIGLDENDVITTDTIALNGVAQVAGVVKWQRVFHAYVSAWGTGGSDAAGNITITNTGQTATYLTIAATYNESDGAAIFCPTGALVTMESVFLVMTDAATANAAILVKNSAINVNGVGADPDLMYMEHRATIGNSGIMDMDGGINTCQTGAKITFSETYMGAVENGLTHIHVLVIEDE